MTFQYVSLEETAVFHETDDVFREHILWDVAGPLFVGIGIGVVSYGIRRFIEWLGLRRRRRKIRLAEAEAMRRAVLCLLERQAEHGDKQAADILEELRKDDEQWR